jgi:hypothetical protein
VEKLKARKPQGDHPETGEQKRPERVKAAQKKQKARKGKKRKSGHPRQARNCQTEEKKGKITGKNRRTKLTETGAEMVKHPGDGGR